MMSYYNALPNSFALEDLIAKASVNADYARVITSRWCKMGVLEVIDKAKRKKMYIKIDKYGLQ